MLKAIVKMLPYIHYQEEIFWAFSIQLLRIAEDRVSWQSLLFYNFGIHYRINVDVRGIVYCVSVRAGGLREWQFAHARLKAASPSERHRLLSVLGCTSAPHLLHRLVLRILSLTIRYHLADYVCSKLYVSLPPPPLPVSWICLK